MKKYIRKTLPENVQTIMTYQSKKWSTKFNVKDKTEFCHQGLFCHQDLFILFIMENVPIKHVQRNTVEKLIPGSRKE